MGTKNNSIDRYDMPQWYIKNKHKHSVTKKRIKEVDKKIKEVDNKETNLKSKRG